ncbi:MAG: VOC family protein [Bryobacterales bacterium]|nr:VOC family protein [Bryobacterales bacterium]
MKITAILFMVSLEPSVEFWTKRMGFELTASVPHGGKMGFAMLHKGQTELMLQSHESAAEDLVSTAEHCRNSKSVLYIEVEDFEDLKKRIAGMPVALPERTTFYGMREIGVMEPGGHLVLFASAVKR